jgi:hypothetical protein
VPGLLGDFDHEPIGRHARAAGHGRAVASGFADHRGRLARDRGLVDCRDPFDHGAVTGDQLAGVDDHDVAADQLGSGLGRPVTHGRDGLGAHRAERVRLRAAAALGERLRDVREHDGQPQPDRDRERVPGRVVSPAERAAAEHLDQPSDGRDRRADLDHEHHGVADLDPRVELDQAVDNCAADDVRPKQGNRATLGHGWDLRRGHDRPPARRSRARFSSSTFTPGSPKMPSDRPVVYWEISPITFESERWRTAATRWA